MDGAFELAEFDRYVEETGISDEEYPAAFARWISERTAGSERPAEGSESQGPTGAATHRTAGASPKPAARRD
jgi:hypothetical protein